MTHAVIEEDLLRINAEDLPWSNLSGKTVLIAGAAGFLPAYMVQSILCRNDRRLGPPTRVIAMVRNAAQIQSRFADFSGRPDLEMVVQDVCDGPPHVTCDVHVVIHAASQASPKFYGRDPVGTLAANVIGTQNLLKLAHDRASERFLYFSSSEVYGELAPHQVPVREDQFGYLNPATVRACYGEGKRAGETLCVSWHHQYGVPAIIVRPFHTYGPGMAADDGRIYADIVADVVAGRNVVMKSDGSARRAFCYLADAVAGFFTALLRGKPGEAYNVGNDRAELSVLELTESVISLFPERGLRVVRIARSDAESPGYIGSVVSRVCPDITKIAELGWRPTTGIEEGFRRTIEWAASSSAYGAEGILTAPNNPGLV